jgi:hypothetical protein
METAEPGSGCSGTRHFVVVGSSPAGCIRAFAIPVGFTPFEDTDFFCDPEKTTATLGEEKQTDKNRNVPLQERTRSVPFAQPKTLNEIFRDQVWLSAFRPLAREVVDVLNQLQRQEDPGSQPLSALPPPAPEISPA